MKRVFFFLVIIALKLDATEITLSKYDLHDVPEICAIEPILKKIYLQSFSHVYKDYWTESFRQSFIHHFDTYFETLKKNEHIFLVVAKKNARIAGWMLVLCHEQLAIIDMICVDPVFQQQGIGTSLVFSIKNYVPHLRSIAVVTKKINAVSPLFYETLGFVKTNFLHADYRADEVQGYQLSIDINPTIELFEDHQHRTIELRQLYDEKLFAQASSIFTAAIVKAYAHISAQDLKLDKNLTLEERLNNYFQQEELIPFCQKKIVAIGAFFENHLIGYISCDNPTKLGELYIRQLAVDTNYWHNGIGKKLVFSVLKLFPSTTCLTLVTRRKNECARIFYTHLGFNESEEYVHPPWDREDFIGYIKTIERF
jgi:ribosomal protein S18 acetylase RimI-like enzyme